MRADELPTRILTVSGASDTLVERDPINLTSLIQFARIHVLRVLGWACVGICAAAIFIFLAPTYYMARTTLLLNPTDARSPTESLLSASNDPATYVFSQIEIVQSDEVLNRVIKAGTLVDDAEFGNGGASILARLGRLLARTKTDAKAPQALREEAVMARLRRALSVRRLGLSEAIEISVAARAASRAAAIANLIATSYIDSRIDQNRLARQAAIGELRERLDSLQQKASTLARGGASPAASGSAERTRDQFRDLQDTTQAYRSLYGAILQRESLSGNTPGWIITPAKPPLYHSWPNGLLTLAIGLSIGCIIGLGHGLLVHVTEPVITSANDLEPFVRSDRIYRVSRQHWWTWRVCRSDSTRVQPSYLKQSDRIAKALVTIALRLRDSRAPSPEPKLIGVVGVSKNSGSSTIAAHLTRVLCGAYESTLLIDANWRRPRNGQSKHTGINERAEATLDIETATLWFSSGTALLSVLRSRKVSADLKNSQKLYDFLRSAAEKTSSCVVIDFHSLEDTPDFDNCRALLDHVIVVGELRRTPVGAVRQLFLSIPQSKTADIILNKT